MEKDIMGSLLLDFYGNLLTEKQREVMRLYVECDTGLSEIATMLGSSRQAIYDIVKASENLLASFEQKMRAVDKYLKNRELLLETQEIVSKHVQNNSDLLIVSENIDKVIENL